MSVHVLGTGMTPFRRHTLNVRELAVTAARDALSDAEITPGEVGAVFFANSLQGLLDGQEAIRGHVALQELGLPVGTPIVNIEAACASSSFAVHLAAAAAAGGERVLVIGAEKMCVPDKQRTFTALASARDIATASPDESPSVFMDLYAEFAKVRMARYGLTVRQMAAVAAKNSWHGSMNPLAQYRQARTVQQVLDAPVIADPLTRYMCSPISDGAAAMVLGADGSGPRLRATAVVGPGHSSDSSAIAQAAEKAYALAGLGPADLDVVEVHDASAVAEIAAYEGLGLCEEGGGGRLVESGATTLGGAVPVNASGGLSSRGHPVGATGIAQLVELADQLRRRSGDRQVPGARVALAENHGGSIGPAPAAVCVSLLTVDRPAA